ncbi:hypothetical protein GUJ93_ZPchr0013g35004 [Zizania palustris]|uniref:Protein kinase domain-containing protein n=1 Tax=Zizania palustris TaxID=103762 RepID=A0A8J6C0Y4_ZIZPA|nr:hypothetical protein GUJ93_ZPchr0013g35004 [Zizania palustris]
MPPRLLLTVAVVVAAVALLPAAAARHGQHGPPPPPPLAKGGSSVLTTALISAAAVLVVVLVYLCVAIAVRRFRRREPPAATSSAAARAAAFLRRHGLHQHRPSFTYEQLRAATAGFDPSRKLGDGGFGTVFLAHLPPNGRPAAVKRLHVPPSPSPSFPSASATITKSFCNEVLILSALRHPNLVRLHGFCADPRALLLVYDFIASALEYLHFGVKPPVVHRDVTSSNIFVEADMRARLGDFGLSRLLAPPDACATAPGRELVCCTAPQGTPGYLDPDYHRSFQLTEKSDVYSFGVVVLELVTGLRPVDVGRERRDVTLADWVVAKIQVGALREVVDQPVLSEGPSVMASVEAVAELAFRCVAPDKDDRPDALETLTELRRIQGMLSEVSAPNGA